MPEPMGAGRVLRRLSEPLVYAPQLDTACTTEDMEELHRELTAAGKLRVRADAFAQYVMLS